MQVEKGVVREHVDMGSGYRRLTIYAPEVCAQVQPGQFVHLRVPGLEASALRRPFSLYRAEDGCISVLYKQVGRGTRDLALLPEGKAVDFLGPLGNGFPWPAPEGRQPLLLAGGYGVAPLYLLATHLSESGVLMVGGRTRADILCTEDFEKLGWPVEMTTEDGSDGRQGLVTDALDVFLEKTERPVVVYACGPEGMLRAIDERLVARDIPGWLSLDKNMGCGVGACLACVQRVRLPDGTRGWKRVCCDGPVFAAGEIVWDTSKGDSTDG